MLSVVDFIFKKNLIIYIFEIKANNGGDYGERAGRIVRSREESSGRCGLRWRRIRGKSMPRCLTPAQGFSRHLPSSCLLPGTLIIKLFLWKTLFLFCFSFGLHKWFYKELMELSGYGRFGLWNFFLSEFGILHVWFLILVIFGGQFWNFSAELRI